MIGSTIKVVVTAENGNTFPSDPTAKVKDVDLGVIEIESAKATKANEVTVTLANPVISSEVEISLAKGTNEISVDEKWNDAFDVVTLTADSNLSNGTYTVTLTDVDDETNTDSAEFEVEDRYVYEIIIDTDKALTDNDENKKSIAYAHYDVVDQYGESMRASTSIMWSGSADIKGDKATGKLTISKSNENDDWVYGEQIYITGVYAKTGLSTQKTLTVGTSQELNSLEIAGFLKKGTSTLITEEEGLPAGFGKDTYYLLFRALDQNGVELPIEAYDDNDITFSSKDVLVVKEISDLEPNGVTVEGVEYGAAFIQPGINVAKGGTTTVTAISNKTGVTDDIEIYVGLDTVVKSFKLLAPTVTVADGDTVEVPFVALDKNDNPITDFVTLAKQETFNTLSFTASEGELKLAEQNDGTAKLTWTDAEKYQGIAGWAQSQTTDGIARPISFTVVVVAGETDNELISVEDKRRPTGVIAVNADKVYTEGAPITFSAGASKAYSAYESFQFQDQYYQTIEGTDKDKVYGDSTGFFRYAAKDSTGFVSSDLKGYDFGVRVTYAGSENIKYTAGADGKTVRGDAQGHDGDTKTFDGFAKQAVILCDAYDDEWNAVNKPYNNDGTIEFTTGTAVQSAATGEGFKFDIVQVDPADGKTDQNYAKDWQSVSPAKFIGITVVDLSQVKSIAISDLGTLYVGEDGDVTGEGQIAASKLDTNNGPGSLGADEKTGFADDADKGLADAAEGTAYQKKVVLTGKYNGDTVTIPAKFYKVAGNKVTTTVEELGNNTIDKIVPYVKGGTDDGLSIQDLYDKSTAKGVSKLGEDTIKATIYNIYSADYEDAKLRTGKAITYNKLKDDATKTKATWTDATTASDATIDAVIGTDTIAAGTLIKEAKAKINQANTAITEFAETITGIANAEAIKTEVNQKANNNNVDALIADAGTKAGTTIFNTATTKVKLSDQKPVATTIDGLKASYTIAPTATKITNPILKSKIGVTGGDVVVKDQYGVTMAGATITYRASDLEEADSDYAENNFTVSSNDSENLSLEGAERANTFTLTLSSGAAEASTVVTVGADTLANITGDDNNYLDHLIGTGEGDGLLEDQRLAGLG